MSGKKVLGWGGVAAVGAGSYYLYSAGGSPKLAEKKMEHDAATAVRKMRGDFPGQDKEAKKAGEEGLEAIRARAEDLGEQFKKEGQRFDAKFDQARHDAEKRLEETRREAATKVNHAADKFDKKVIEGVNDTKGWFSSWFGGK